MSHLAPHQELFKQLVTLGESVTEALDYTQLISTNGEGELEKTLTALGERELSPAATTRTAPSTGSQPILVSSPRY